MVTIIDGTTKLSAKQIRFNEIFTVERVLSSRGFSIKTEGTGEDTVLGKPNWTHSEANTVFNIFDNVEYRNELLDYIEGRLDRANVSSTTNELITINGFKNDRQCFSTTYEWYIGELLVRKFMAFSSSYGVTLNNICRNSDDGTSGDFDVLSVLGDMNLIYLECKSGETKQKSIRNTLERSISLHCTASIFIRQDINENGLKQQMLFKHPMFDCTGNVVKLSIKNAQDSTIYKWFNCYFVDVASGDVENKLRTVLRTIEASRVLINISTEPDDGDYKSLGYDFDRL